MAYTTINKPADYFNTKLYSGDSNTTQDITGVGFQPDWVWIKARTEVHQHNLFDVIRGVTKNIVSNGTNAEATTDQYGYLASFDSDGFTTQKGSNTNQWNVNQSGEDYVAWNWLAGGTASDNTDGSITSSVSANTTSGFSVVKWTGTGGSQTIGHGLGVKPEMIIIKNTDKTCAWVVYNKTIDATDYISLNDTDARADYAGYFADTEPTSSVFTVGTDTDACGASGQVVIAYCFNSVKGYSKIGSYTGNGSTDGTFVYTGFKPAFVMTKSTSNTGNWKTSWSVDHLNGTGRNLAPNLSAAENTANKIDILSNGFKCRATDTDRNGSGRTYIYMAFAENPLVTSGGTPATAR